jgi:transcriptional regulator with XRE-family HTH domain
METPAPSTKKLFARRLNAAMERAGISGLQLAAITDVDKGSVVRWRKGRTLPRQENLLALASALKLPAQDLLPANGTPVEASPPAQEKPPPPPSEDEAVALMSRIVTLADSVKPLAPDLMAVLADARAFVSARKDETSDVAET